MKGSPEQPKCGFSAKAAQTLAACGSKFGYVDVDCQSRYPPNFTSIRQMAYFSPIICQWRIESVAVISF